MPSRRRMAEAMYAMDILAAKLDAGNRLEDWRKETGLDGPPDWAWPTSAQLGRYEGWLMGRGLSRELDDFRNVVSSFVFLLCREAFGRVEALDELVCAEDVFL